MFHTSVAASRQSAANICCLECGVLTKRLYSGWSFHGLLCVFLTLHLVFAASVGLRAQALVTGKAAPMGDDALVRAIVTAEETYLVLSRKMDVISRGLLDLRLPGPSADAASVFAPSVTTVDIGPTPAMIGTNATLLES